MYERGNLTRRQFLAVTGATVGVAAAARFDPGAGLAAPVTTPHVDIAALRRDIVNSPLRVALHRAKVFTGVFQDTKDKPWVLRKALALREYFQTVPLYIRRHDRLAGSISELPGAMPVFVELGIGENGIYTGERPDRAGYLEGQVPEEIRDYWKNRNMWDSIGRRSSASSPTAVPTRCRYASCTGTTSRAPYWQYRSRRRLPASKKTKAAVPCTHALPRALARVETPGRCRRETVAGR